MKLFFIISGFLFVTGCSIILNYIYNIFPVNRITKFLNSNEQTIFSKINICILPNILWSFIELPILSNNYYFIVGLMLNIFINCSIMYIIIYGYSILSNKDNEIVKVTAIICANIFGFLVNYICLLASMRKCDPIYSIMGVFIITVFYIIIKIFPPKTEFFRGKEE